ncbi:unnamed protein product, partial [Scytosiphon promiscuus]
GGALSVAVTYKGGIVIGTVSNADSPLAMDMGTRKIGWLTNGNSITYSGLAADSRWVMAAQRNSIPKMDRLRYEAVVPVGTLVAEIAMKMQEYTQMGGVRPFGVALLVAGLDLDGLKLYRLDSAGSYSAWKAVAIGKGSAEAQEKLHKHFKDSMNREDALELVLDVIQGCSSGIRREDVETAIIEKSQYIDLQ